MLTEDQQNLEEKRGRPLDLSRNKIILETTINLVSEYSYDSLTIDAVAKKAKVGKGTIYRRWSTKKELVIDAAILMCPFETSKNHLNKNQDLRGQIIELLSLMCLEENTNYQKAMSAICSAVAWDEQSDIRESFYSSYRNVMHSILKTHIRDHLISDEDLELVTDIGPALIMYQDQVKKGICPAYIERAVDKLIMPLIVNKN